MPDLARERERMVREQIAGRGICNAAVLNAFRVVPREAFLAPELAAQAYEDHPLPIAAGQTISQPYIVALMLEASGVKPGDRVLEIGAGSGYAAALLGQIAAEVIAVERHAELADFARARVAQLSYRNVRILDGDGTEGWPEAAPFDAILVSAAGPEIPQPLINQLAPNGLLVMPIGNVDGPQQLLCVTKESDGTLRQKEMGAVRFVPLVRDREAPKSAGQ